MSVVNGFLSSTGIATGITGSPVIVSTGLSCRYYE